MRQNPEIVNNTPADLRPWSTTIVANLRAGKAAAEIMPDDLADLFAVEVIEVDGVRRAIVNAA